MYFATQIKNYSQFSFLFQPENWILRLWVFPAGAMALKLALWAFVWAAILGLVLSAPGGETGSWCYKPSREAYWGHASGTCCPGNMGSDRRCYGLRGDGGKCTKFYNCCIHQFGSGNKESDPCNWELPSKCEPTQLPTRNSTQNSHADVAASVESCHAGSPWRETHSTSSRNFAEM